MNKASKTVVCSLASRLCYQFHRQCLDRIHQLHWSLEFQLRAEHRNWFYDQLYDQCCLRLRTVTTEDLQHEQSE